MKPVSPANRLWLLKRGVRRICRHHFGKRNVTNWADRVGEDTTFGKIIELVEEAQDSKSEAERVIDRFSKYYTPAVLVFAIVVWLFSGILSWP